GAAIEDVEHIGGGCGDSQIDGAIVIEITGRDSLWPWADGEVGERRSEPSGSSAGHQDHAIAREVGIDEIENAIEGDVGEREPARLAADGHPTAGGKSYSVPHTQ